MNEQSELIFQKLCSIIDIKNCLRNEFMNKHTSFQLGGPCDFMTIPQTKEEVRNIIYFAKENEIPFYIMGNGTNVVVRDKGIRGIVIKTTGLDKVMVDHDLILSGAGALIGDVSQIALQHHLTGLEFAVGIPGTYGGAIVMNAGAYGSEMKAVTKMTLCLDADGNEIKLFDEEHEFGYRKSAILSRNLIVIESSAKLIPGEHMVIKEKMENLQKQRWDKQPMEMPSAGSVFKRPEGYFVGKLVQDSNLRGYTIGGAQVSNKHCGFIVNHNHASANDVIQLIEYIQKTIYNLFGVVLETEVKIVGEE